MRPSAYKAVQPNPNPDLWPYELKISILMPWEMFAPISLFMCLFVFELGARIRHGRTDRQRQRRTVRQDTRIMRPSWLTRRRSFSEINVTTST